MNTGENAEALRKITDLTRKGSVLLLSLHFYIYCYAAFKSWHLTWPFVEHILLNLAKTGLFHRFYISKAAAFLLLIVSLIGYRGKKDEKLKLATALKYFLSGLLVYILSYLAFKITASVQVLALLYIAVATIGYLLTLNGGALLSRLISQQLAGDIFNRLQETFPQEERLLENEYSINLPAQYNLKGKIRKSWINIINPFRALLVAGTPGSTCPEKAIL